MVRSWVETRRRRFEERAGSQPGTPSAPAPVAVVEAPPPAPVAPPVVETPPLNLAPLNLEGVLPSVMQGVSGPLMAAVSQVAGGLREQGQRVSALEEAKAFASLMNQAVNVTRTTAATLEIGRDAPLRQLILEAVADLVAAHYRAVGQLQPAGLTGQITAAITQIAVEGARREDLMPGLGARTQARPGLDMLRAMGPVIHAVTRYAFGRNPLVLITEVAWEMQYKAVDITRRLSATGATLEAWQALYGATLHAVAEAYAEAHHSEADRVLRLSRPQHGEVPMNNVWDLFDRHTDLLAQFGQNMLTLSAVPADSSRV